MKIPYTHDDMIITVNNLVEEKTEERMIEIVEIINSFAKNKFPFFSSETSKAEKNKILADYNGISVDVLISSPNYEKLINEYRDEYILTYISLLAEETLLTEKEIFSLFYVMEVERINHV